MQGFWILDTVVPALSKCLSHTSAHMLINTKGGQESRIDCPSQSLWCWFTWQQKTGPPAFHSSFTLEKLAWASSVMYRLQPYISLCLADIDFYLQGVVKEASSSCAAPQEATLTRTHRHTTRSTEKWLHLKVPQMITLLSEWGHLKVWAVWLIRKAFFKSKYCNIVLSARKHTKMWADCWCAWQHISAV